MPVTQDRWINKVLGGTRYVIQEKLGEGGMGAVYLAEDRQLHTWVVIKTPHSSMVRDPEFSARFKREVQSLIALSHPRIVRVLDVGQYGEFPFVVLQYLSGGSLESRLYPTAATTARPQLLTQVCAWLTEIASALDFIHLQGYIHRDIKPANILFDEEQHAYLTDFGIAKVMATVEGSPETKLTATGMMMGTAEYMAPELLQGKPLDHRVDQYALAVTVFEALSGTRPYEGNTPAALAFAQVQQPIPQVHQRVPGLPVDVSRASSRALALSPEERFRSCEEFATAVRGTCPTVVSPRRSERDKPLTSVKSRKRVASETLATSVVSKKLPDTDRSRKQAEYSDLLRATELQVEIDVEATKKWKHEVDVWIAQSNEEAGGNPKQQYEVFLSNMEKLREQLKLEGDELESQKQSADLWMLVRRQEIEVDPPAMDKTQPTNDLDTASTQFCDASEAVRGHLVELRKLRIPALFAGWRPWLIALGSWAMLAGIAGFLIDPAVLPIETKVEPIEWRVFCGVVMWLPVFITMWILLAISRSQTYPIYEVLVERNLVAQKSRQRFLKLLDGELKQREARPVRHLG